MNITPAENDVALAQLMNQEVEQYRIISAAENRLQWCGLDSIKKYEQEIEDAKQRILELQTEKIPYEQRYNDERWSRYYLVTNGNGHVHTSTACSTCFITTSFAWLPDCSGMSEEELVAEFGERVCTVCCPSAPVTPGLIGRRDREAQEAKAQEKAEKEAARLEKALLPDGSALKLKGGEGEPKTLIAGQRALSNQMESMIWYGETHPFYKNWEENVEMLLVAISNKTGEPILDIRQKTQVKVEKKVAKERGISYA
jgi:beta-glucosidase-like glycosyl hydrolase